MNTYTIYPYTICHTGTGLLAAPANASAAEFSAEEQEVARLN
jgi:hypothetical protein